MEHPRDMLRRHGLRASKQRGQNFLTQAATARAIAASAGINADDVVVEVGPGLGALTLALAPLCRRVIALELDRGVFAALLEVLAEAGADNVEPRHTDALKTDWRALAAEAGGPLVVAGNLPYSISSPLLLALIGARDAWRGATLMLQREVVRRMAAPLGGRDYGRLGVQAQTFCQVRAGQVVGPDQFFPRPKVASQVAHLTPRERPLVELDGPGDEAWFSRVVAAAFGQRRKMLANALAGGLGLPREVVQEALAGAGIDPALRAERLSPPELGAAARALAANAREIPGAA